MPKSIHSPGHRALIAGLIEARKATGLSQATLAERLRCHQSFIARIESGQRRIDVPELVILARALGVDAREILQRVEEATPDGERI